MLFPLYQKEQYRTVLPGKNLSISEAKSLLEQLISYDFRESTAIKELVLKILEGPCNAFVTSRHTALPRQYLRLGPGDRFSFL